MQYTIKLDPRGQSNPRYRCKHVNYVENTHFAEREFLFSAYSVFDVEVVTWSSNCTYLQPHEIVLRCSRQRTGDRQTNSRLGTEGAAKLDSLDSLAADP
jgi:hypothetical protein